MNTPLSDFINNTLYPTLYESLDSAGVLPEFGFRRNKDGYQSTTAAKITGREGKTPGQVYVYSNNVTRLIDHSEGHKDIIDYVRYERSGKDIGFIPAVNELATMVGLKAPTRELTEKERQQLELDQHKARIWEAAINFCIQCIQDSKYKKQAVDVVGYLTERRKYTAHDIQFIGLGYLPNQTALFSHLTASGFTETEARAAIKLPGFIGVSHQLIIPIWNKAGKPVGLAARNVNYTKTDEAPKYLYSEGLVKGDILYNLHGKAKNGRLILVEGQLDAAITTARGFEWGSVAALGAKDLTTGQLSRITDAKAKEVYLCLDNEESTVKSLKKAIAMLQGLEALEDRIYIITLPEGVKDVDELITQQGIDAFTKAVNGAEVYYEYLAAQVLKEFLRHRDSGEHYLINDAIEDLQRLGSTVKNPTHRDRLTTKVKPILHELGIESTDEAFKAAIETIRYKDDQAKQDSALQNLLKTAGKLASEGKTKDAIDKLQNDVRAVKLKDRRTEYKNLLSADLSEKAIIQRVQDKPAGVKTGYKVKVDNDYEDIELPAGALTFLAAPTNHGKTAAMINIALNVLEEDKEKNVHLFTYEESGDTVLMYTLNTYIDDAHLNASKKKAYAIKGFFKTGDYTYITPEKRGEFRLKKDAFFNQLINPGRLKIHYVNYSADELINLIEFIREVDPNAVILIDYVQKLRSDKKGSLTNRPTELKLICEDLNDCAINTGLPIALGAQFNRAVLSPTAMHPTQIAEASDIEKIAAEIIGLWNCSKKIAGNLDRQDIARIVNDYGLSTDEFSPEPAIILEVLKSRSLPSGAFTKLDFNGLTGKIKQRPAEYRLTEPEATTEKFKARPAYNNR